MTEIVLLTREDCHFCDQAKELLDRLGAEYALHVREVALDSVEGRALAARSGAPFPPVIFVDGEVFSYGRLPERKLRQRLARVVSA